MAYSLTEQDAINILRDVFESYKIKFYVTKKTEMFDFGTYLVLDNVYTDILLPIRDTTLTPGELIDGIMIEIKESYPNIYKKMERANKIKKYKENLTKQ
jgi:hypothetical protein